MRSLKRLGIANARGDTIIEVMVVLAILGMAIGISYSTANNSLLDIRQAEEHAQATEYAQSQLEILRTMLAPTSPNIFIAGPYCMPQTPPYTPIAVPNSSCQIGGEPFSIQINDLSVEFPLNTSIPPDTFQILVTWPDVRGQGNDTVTLDYQLHETP
jgi:prepilin-type N-terminal cleavage/methylation domain-containing protein